jgi:hypothetical protein
MSDKKVRAKVVVKKLVPYAALRRGTVFHSMNMGQKEQLKLQKITNSAAREYYGTSSDSYANWYPMLSWETVEVAE